MDRNGKKQKAAPSEASRLAQRSDMKTSARDVLGRSDAALGARGGKGAGNAPGAPANPGRKGHRG
jgi:hypothetical protein